VKEYALELAGQKADVRDKLNILREYVQAYLLKIMHEPRFSEDLDFSLCKGTSENFLDLMRKIKRELELAGYEVEVKAKEVKTVQSALFRFSGLLHEAGLSSIADQKFTVKVEVDTNPPAGAVTETQVVNKYFPITFLAYGTSSLLSGKLHAVLTRKYTKGRDLFDLGWYLSRWKGIVPNIPMLVNALQQTGWEGPLPDESNWRGLVADAVSKMDWARVFLQNPADMTVLSQENVLGLVRGVP